MDGFPVHTSESTKVSFNDAYKEWRNRARKYQLESVANTAMRFLQKLTKDRLEDIQRAPWQMMLSYLAAITLAAL